jgi:signal peptidase I
MGFLDIYLKTRIKLIILIDFIAWFFLDLVWFFQVFFISVRFFWFQAYKTESVSFFKILIGFFYTSIF